jgi:hypothetical protein
MPATVLAAHIIPVKACASGLCIGGTRLGSTIRHRRAWLRHPGNPCRLVARTTGCNAEETWRRNDRRTQRRGRSQQRHRKRGSCRGRACSWEQDCPAAIVSSAAQDILTSSCPSTAYRACARVSSIFWSPGASSLSSPAARALANTRKPPPSCHACPVAHSLVSQ